MDNPFYSRKISAAVKQLMLDLHQFVPDIVILGILELCNGHPNKAVQLIQCSIGINTDMVLSSRPPITLVFPSSPVRV